MMDVKGDDLLLAVWSGVQARVESRSSIGGSSCALRWQEEKKGKNRIGQASAFVYWSQGKSSQVT